MSEREPEDHWRELPILHRLSPELLWDLIAALVLLVLAALLVYAYPKTTITMGVQRSSLDDQGRPRPGTPQEALRNALDASGIRVDFMTQDNAKDEKPNLEWMVNDPRVDFALSYYTGAPLPTTVTSAFTSFGVVAQTPILFFARAGTPPIHSMRDLKGRKLVIWSSPEGRAKAYSGETSGASVYSTDRVLQNLFGRIGVTPENSSITNVWPQLVSLEQDWDVWVSVGLPGRISNTHKMYDAILDGRVELVRFDDLDGVRRRLPELRRGVLAASTVSSEKGVPRTDVPYLAYVQSIVARKGLDRGLEEPLAEAVLATYSRQTLLLDERTFPNFTGSHWFKPNAAAVR